MYLRFSSCIIASNIFYFSKHFFLSTAFLTLFPFILVFLGVHGTFRLLSFSFSNSLNYFTFVSRFRIFAADMFFPLLPIVCKFCLLPANVREFRHYLPHFFRFLLDVLVEVLFPLCFRVPFAVFHGPSRLCCYEFKCFLLQSTHI